MHPHLFPTGEQADTLAKIREDDIGRLKEQVDLLEVVEEHVNMRRAGGGRMKGICPFHEERSPSFTVETAKNLWHCFGCQRGGDVFTFLAELEGMRFPEAAEVLARRYGVELTYEEMTPQQQAVAGLRARLLTVHEQAARFFTYRLLGEEGQVARDYLKSRGFGREDVDAFGVGFSPESPRALWELLVDNGHRESDLLESGLFVRSKFGPPRDRFAGRLVFPIRSVSGDVVAFAGRIVPGVDYGPFGDPPKYMNSPETKLYNKSSVLFGLPQARKEVQRTGRVLVVEGYTDVMALHREQAHMAVATCGTALTREHVRVLSRMAREVVLAFDADAAGEKAAERGWEAAAGFDVRVKVLPLPEGTDPAEWADKVGVGGVNDAIDEAVPVERFLISRVAARHDVADTYGRADAMAECLEVLRRVPDPTVRLGLAEQEIASALRLSPSVVVAQAQSAGVSLTHEVRPASSVGASSGVAVDRGRARERLEREVLWFALEGPGMLPEAWWAGQVSRDDFRDPVARRVFVALQDAGGAGVTVEAVEGQLGDDAEGVSLVRAVSLSDGPHDPSERMASDFLNRLLLPRAQAVLQDAVVALSEGVEGAAERYRLANERVRALRGGG